MDAKVRAGIIRVALYIVYPLAFWAIIIMLAGCRTRYVSVPEYHYIAAETKDSAKSFHLDYERWMAMFRRRDSTVTTMRTTITKNERGDTTARETERATEHWHSEQSVIAHYKHIADSLRRELESRSVRVDSIRVPYPVERRLTRWEQVKQGVGGVAISIAGVVIIAVTAYILAWLAMRKSKR